MVQLCLLFAVICVACAGVCAGAAIVICRDYPGEEDKVTEPPLREVSEEDKKESIRRQRELVNFFNYNGDAMPVAEEIEMDLKI